MSRAPLRRLATCGLAFVLTTTPVAAQDAPTPPPRPVAFPSGAPDILTAPLRLAPPVPAGPLLATPRAATSLPATSFRAPPVPSLGAPALRAPAMRALALQTPDEPFFTTRDAWIGLGFVLGTAAMAPLDRHLAGILQDSTLQAHEFLGDAAAVARFLGFPGSAIIGGAMYGVGRLGDMPRLASMGLHSVEAIAISYAFVWTGKNVLGRARPQVDHTDPFDFELTRGFRGGSDYRSFPSGHSAAAFAFAAAVTAESREIWPEATPYLGPLLYAGATAVGVSRMYHNRHWASDAVAGAALGTFSGWKVVRYHYRNPENFVDRWLLPTAVVPTPAGPMFVWAVR